MSFQQGYVKDRPRSGRPKATDQQDDVLIVREAHNSPFTTAEKINEQLNTQSPRNLSTQTIHNRLHAVQLKPYKPAR